MITNTKCTYNNNGVMSTSLENEEFKTRFLCISGMKKKDERCRPKNTTANQPKKAYNIPNTEDF